MIKKLIPIVLLLIIIAVGAVAYKFYDEQTAEVKRMLVSPDYQHKGYGKAILAFLEKQAVKSGYKGFILETSVNQTAAVRLYEKAGFQILKTEIIDGFNCMWYQKQF